MEEVLVLRLVDGEEERRGGGEGQPENGDDDGERVLPDPRSHETLRRHEENSDEENRIKDQNCPNLLFTEQKKSTLHLALMLGAIFAYFTAR